MSEFIKTNGYYGVNYSGTGIYGQPFDFYIFLFFNELGYVYYLEEEDDIDLYTAKEIIAEISNVKEESNTMANYKVSDSNIDMTFFRDDKRFFNQWFGSIQSDKLILNMATQSYSYIDDKIEKTIDIENLQFSFVKC